MLSSRLLSVVALAAWSASCSGDARPAPPFERVQIALRQPRSTIQADVEHSRAGQARTTSELRECWAAPVGSTIEVERRALPFDPDRPLEFAVAVEALPPGTGALGFSVRFEIAIDGGTPVVARELDLKTATESWTRVALDRRPATVHDFRLTARWVGAVPAGDALVRACFAPLHVGSTAADAAPAGPNVLFIAVDTLRADHLGCYGYARATTPRIDALARRGVLFERASSAAPWTLPAFGSLFTALYPSRHRAGVLTEREAAFGTDPPGLLRKTLEHLREDVPTLAELLRARGWRTAGIHSNAYLDPETGLDRGFEEYTHYQYNARHGADLALAWMEAHAAERWFLFVHFMDPHYPYAPPDPWASKFSGRPFGPIDEFVPRLDTLRRKDVDPAKRALLVDLYDGEIAFVDEQVGRLLARLESVGELDRTIVVLVSDHGDEHWEHGSFDHGQSQHVELLHVPLIVSYPPRLPGGRRVAARVRSIDVLPTILDLAGLAPPAGIEGLSLTDPTLVDRDAISEVTLWGTRETKAIQSGVSKLIAAGASDDRLYDLTSDPGERSSRADAARLRARLVEHHAAAPAPKEMPKAIEFPPGTRAHLANLGYAGDDVVHAADGRPAPAEPPKK